MMAELTQLRDSENFNELFLRRKDIQKWKKSMRDYLTLSNEKYENNIFDDIKQEVCGRVCNSMNDLFRIFNFAVQENNLDTFDDFLSSAKIDEIEYQLSQRNYLLEPDRLKQKLQKLKDNLNYVLKEIDSNSLSNEYNTLLDESLNPELRNHCKLPINYTFLVERIDRVKGLNDSYVYYGQINSMG